MAKKQPAKSFKAQSVMRGSRKAPPPEHPRVGLNPGGIKDQMAKDNAVRKAVSDGPKVPIEKLSEAKAGILKKAGLVGGPARPLRAPKQSTFNKTKGGVKEAGKREDELTPEAKVRRDIYNEIDASVSGDNRARVQSQLHDTAPVFGGGAPMTRGGREVVGHAEMAKHHGQQALQASLSSGLGARQRRAMIEGHRAAANTHVDAMSAEERRRNSKMTRPCPTPGCSNMSLPISQSSCGSETGDMGGSCNVKTPMG